MIYARQWKAIGIEIATYVLEYKRFYFIKETPIKNKKANEFAEKVELVLSLDFCGRIGENSIKALVVGCRGPPSIVLKQLKKRLIGGSIMDVYRPKKDPRPSRRKDKDNPYEIFSVGIDTDTPHFYVSFKDGQDIQICMEIEKAVFDMFDRFELDDLSFLNEWDRHIEHNELKEATLQERVIMDIESVEMTAFKDIRNERLYQAIAVLPKTQRRRLVMYYFRGLTYKEIAERERCTHPAVIKSVKAAISKLKKYL